MAPSNPNEKKACAAVLRQTGSGQELLVFRHPQAGCQIVKGGIEAGETPEAAAEREMYEESGRFVRAQRQLGMVTFGDLRQDWYFVLCDGSRLPDVWSHRTSDGSGHLFEFFWHRLSDEPAEDWHPVYADALRFIKSRCS